MEQIRIVADVSPLLNALSELSRLRKTRNAGLNIPDRLTKLLSVKTLSTVRAGELRVGFYPSERLRKLLAALRAGSGKRLAVKTSGHRQSRIY